MVTIQTSNDLKADRIHIWRIDLDGAIDGLSDLLSADELKRAEAKKQELERYRFIRGRGAMRTILGDYLGVSGGKLEFVLGENGKPSVGHPESNIEFNLSHCEDMALFAVAEAIQVGIDLERIRQRPLQLKIAKRIFPEPIYLELSKLPSDLLDSAFFHHWTELEARVKCFGDGIFSPEKKHYEISTRHFSPQEGWIACIAASGTDSSSFELKHFRYGN